MFGMNPEQLIGTIRQFLPFFSGIAAALGFTWFDGVAGAVLATIGPVGGLISLIWSLVSKKQANILAAAAAIPAVKRIELQPTSEGISLERATPSNVVVAR